MFSRLDPFTLIVRAMVLFTAMPIHECAHGLIANKLGDHTARDQGRLTLNPFAHLDFAGSLMILVAGFGWAKPVPVNPYNFRRNSRSGMALTAAAGPVSNIILATITLTIAKILYVFSAPTILFYVFILMSQINLSLAVFNLLPIVPLDGSRILAYFLPDRLVYKMEQHQQIIYIVFLVIVLFTPFLDVPISFLSNFIFSAINKLTSLFGVLPLVA